MELQCIKCLGLKLAEDFIRRKWGKPVCKACYNAKQRAYRTANKNVVTARYEKTRQGFLMRLYRNMESRITGVQKQKHHLYAGKSLLPREAFYEWAEASPAFHDLFDKWQASGYDRKLAPSVDRVESAGGYEIGNMEWVTHSENSRRGSVSRYNWKKYAAEEMHCKARSL